MAYLVDTNIMVDFTRGNAKAADYGLKIGLIWWVIGMALATGYTIHVYRNVSGKVSVSGEEGNQHY